MKRKTAIKWFTLLEMMIVIVIVWILAVVLTESYITISRTALRIEQEKNISEESLVLTQIFQSVADEATIDYEKYWSKLQDSNWFTWTLYLTWWQWSWTSIYTTGDCLDLDKNFESNEDGNISQSILDYTGCYLAMKQWEENEETQLTIPWNVVISKVMFRIIPFDSDENYFTWEETNKIVINDVHQPAFWMFIHLYAPLYQPTWTNKIDLPLQLFLNLNL